MSNEELSLAEQDMMAKLICDAIKIERVRAAQDRYRKGASREKHLANQRAREHTERYRKRKREWALSPHENAKRLINHHRYYTEHRKELLAKRRAYTKKNMTENPDRVRAKKRDYYNRNRDRILALQRVRQTALPKWANRNEIIEIYRNCPSDMEVDHIVPLRGRTAEGCSISGLHVVWNLQYLSRKENLSKRNRMRPEEQALCENIT